ncbi:MAG: DnaB family ATPase [Paraclostridium sp.]
MEMNIERRQKYKGSGRTINKSDRKLDIKFDLTSLNLMCSYILSENKNIRRSHLINMRNLFDLLDITYYQNDPEKMIRVDFIKIGLEAKILKNLKDKDIILKYISGGLTENIPLLDVKCFNELSNTELEWINETISEALKFSYIYNDIDRMIDICTRFKSSDYRSRGSIVQEFEVLISEIQTKFRRARSESLTESVFTLKNGMFEEVMKDIYDQLTDPSSKLLTGMQGMNELLGGGFETGRVYLLLGLTGGGKSLSLLNMAYQMKKYNTDYKPKDPTKIPVILYLTMENTVKESVQRLFEIATEKELTDYSYKEVMQIMKEDGELYLSDESPIDIVIKYVPNRSIDTSALYTIVEDMEDEGYEVICVIQDHVKRIRSIEKTADVRFELGNVINEFKVFSAIKDIPFITNSHLNRDAAGKIDEASAANKGDLIRMLGRANVGESMLMLDNTDGAYIIAQEYDNDGTKYLGVKRVKLRAKATLRDTIFLPYNASTSIKLQEDLYSQVPVFKDTLKDIPSEANIFNGNISKYQGNLKDIDEILEGKKRDVGVELNDDNNIFTSSSSRYSSAKQSSSINIVSTDSINHMCGDRKDSVALYYNNTNNKPISLYKKI